MDSRPIIINALGQYGIEARVAVPALVEAFVSEAEHGGPTLRWPPAEMTPGGELRPGATFRYHVQPFHGSRIDPASLDLDAFERNIRRLAEAVDVPVEDAGAFLDVDTLEDYARAFGRALPDVGEETPS